MVCVVSVCVLCVVCCAMCCIVCVCCDVYVYACCVCGQRVEIYGIREGWGAIYFNSFIIFDDFCDRTQYFLN